jgi:alcohol dehydrogenase
MIEFGVGGLKKLPELLKVDKLDYMFLISDRGLESIGVEEEMIENMAKDTMKSGNISANPRQSTLNDIIELYKKAL